MSTNSSIRIKRKDGTQTGIYCHWDGYIEHNGVILQLAYNTAEKVEELLKLGDISSLRYYTEPYDSKYDIDNPEQDVCVAYCRDRGEGFRQSLQDDEFVYTFDEEEACWYVTVDEYTEDTQALDLLGLSYVRSKKTTLLLDEILKLRDVIDSKDSWRSDEFAEAGMVVDTCIIKAQEARKEIIAREAAEYNAYYHAYCD